MVNTFALVMDFVTVQKSEVVQQTGLPLAVEVLEDSALHGGARRAGLRAEQLRPTNRTRRGKEQTPVTIPRDSYATRRCENIDGRCGVCGGVGVAMVVIVAGVERG